MPDRATVIAATPKCPCFITRGPETQWCATPMRWDHGRGVWVCKRHPHMETTPSGDARLAPKAARDAAMALGEIARGGPHA